LTETSIRKRVTLERGGLILEGGEKLPLVCGAMHYWRHHPSAWAPGLDAMKAMGMKLVDVYVPWGEHERAKGELDFGASNPRLDVARFFALAHERGLKVVARPGPHINAELTYFGLPERVVWDRACQARTPNDAAVMLPMVPVGFPVPSYASEAFHEEVEDWFAACGPILAKNLWPDGPIVMVQIDNEGALYFRDGAYDQDYHPDSIALFRTFLQKKYKKPSALRAAWNEPELTFASAPAPTRFDAKSADALARHLDWVEYQEELLATSMERMARSLASHGVAGVPTMHNLPLGEAATPLNPSRLGGVLDLVALDYYHRATPEEHAVLMRRTTELAVRCDGDRVPAYGAEVGAGFPPFFAPHDEKDSIYTLCAALAYGLRGFNLYMAVERDRWIGAPIDRYGAPRPLADVYKALTHALERLDFFALERPAPVRLVMPRAIRRLARASHAFGPLTPAFFNIMGKGFRETVLEDTEAPSPAAAPFTAETFLRAFENALLARGVPFAYTGGESLGPGTVGAKWIVCATALGLKGDVFAQLRARAAEGCRVTIGPEVPARDGGFRTIDAPHDVAGLELEPDLDAARADALVAERIRELALPTYAVDPDAIHVSVHTRRSDGRPGAIFVMNPTDTPATARIAVRGVDALIEVFAGVATEALDPDRGRITRASGAFELTLPARTVKIFGPG
jgi:beta-galactosidase